MGISFLNSALLWFSALISVPIIIYLINRHRYRRRKWAAMEFLLRALKKNQRRLQLENLLLLIIRCLIVLFLVLAVARPVFRSHPLVSDPGEKQNWIIVLDTSYSMDYRSGDSSLFDQARRSLSRMLERSEFVSGIVRDGDGIAVTTMSHTPRVVVGRSTVTAELRSQIRSEISGLTLSYQPVRTVDSLRLIEELAEQFLGPDGQPEPFRVVLFSDLQKRDWVREDAPLSPEIAESLRRIKDRRGELSVAKLGTDAQRPNVSITDVSMKPELIARDVPLTVNVTVKNQSQTPIENLDLTVRIIAGEVGVDDTEAASEAQVGEVLSLDAGATVTRPLYHRFDDPGFYTVIAEVRSDGLVVDNRRHLVIPVRDEVGVLTVDGDPRIEREDRETFFLEFALQPRDDDLTLAGRFTPFTPRYVTSDQLGDINWGDHQLIVLANVEELPKEAVPSLERHVREGGALMIFLGDQVNAGTYNELLHRDGQGLQPFKIDDAVGTRETPVFLQFEAANHPVARYFFDRKERSYLFGGAISFFRYFQLTFPKPPEAAGGVGDTPKPVPTVPVDVLCRYNDLDASPAILDHAYGRGRVMWFTSSADREWNEFPVWQDFVVFLYESISYLLGFGSKSLNMDVGAPFVRYYDSGDFASEVLLRVPAEESSELGAPRVVRRSMREIEGERRFELSYENTTIPGLYRLDFKRANVERGDSVEFFAVNVDPAEGQLESMTADDFATHFEVQPALFDASERFRDLAKQQDMLRGREYWRWFLGAALLLLLLETALAQIFGRRAR
ncbi:MAG: BatA domain-containing protein [Planctomycetota bacterium]